MNHRRSRRPRDRHAEELNITAFMNLMVILVPFLLITAVFSQVAAADDVEDVQRVCTVIDSMGANVECAVNESKYAVDVTAGASIDDAAQFCTAFSGMVEALTSTLSDSWKMRIFTPQNGDTPAAVCDLN